MTPFVHRLRVRYVECDMQGSPARFDDLVDIEVALQSLTTSSMTTTYAFRRGTDLLAQGWVRHVAVDPHALTKVPWPPEARTALETLLPVVG